MNPYPPNAPAPWPHGPPPMQPILPTVGVGVKIMAGIQCFFGGVALLFSPFTFFQRGLAHDKVSIALYAATWDGPAAPFFYSQFAIGLLLALALLGSGIGLFMSKRWARTLGLVYGASALFMLVVGQIMAALFMYPAITPFLDSTNTVERAGAMGGLIGGIFGAFVGAILPTAMLIVLGRKAIVPQLRD
ncbi:hypothetical protein BH09MYX1_BH09MYX1_56320 [soil metagenome]